MRNWKTFTPEELGIIRASPYVKSATAKMIRFTVAFKEEFWRQYTEEHKPPRQIMQDLGFDVDMIGQNRVDGILIHLREQVRCGETFSDVRKKPENQLPPGTKLPPSKAILKMQHELAYLRQEVEFIKKTILAERKAMLK